MKNQEILDDDQVNNSKEIIDKRTKNLHQKAVIYSVIMILVGYRLMCFEYSVPFRNPDSSFYMLWSVTIIFYCFMISFVLVSFWFLIRKFMRRKDDHVTLFDPYWFQIIKVSFVVWILLFIVLHLYRIYLYWDF